MVSCDQLVSTYAQRRYDTVRVIGVAISTSREQHDSYYMGVSIFVLYPPLLGLKLPAYYILRLLRQFRSLYPYTIAIDRKMLDLYVLSYSCHGTHNIWNAIMFAARIVSGLSLSNLF